MDDRAALVCERLGDAGVEALVIVHQEQLPNPNARYLTGLTGSAAVVIVSPACRAVVIDPRYQEQAAEQCPGWHIIVHCPPQTAIAAAMAWARDRGVTALGYEPDGITAGGLALLQAVFAGELRSVSGVVEAERRHKSPPEVDAIAGAASIADASLQATIARARAGDTEKELAAELDFQMRRRGADESAFDTILAAGTRSSLPHARPSTRRLRAGDLVCVDCGATVDGYRSDITRAWSVGEPTAAARAFFATVLQAHDDVLGMVHPGVNGRVLNRAARAALRDGGIEDCWRHGVGHGVGLQIHEGPSLREGVEVELVAGDVITIEPGAYRAGWGGVRIEDLVVVTDDGCRVLTETPPDLAVIAA